MNCRDEYPCYYCSKWGPCPMCQEKYGLDENGNLKAGPYRTASPPPPELMSITPGDSSLCVTNADILFQCQGCKAEWRLKDTFNLSFSAESSSFRFLQIAWSHKHQGCR